MTTIADIGKGIGEADLRQPFAVNDVLQTVLCY